MFLELPERIEMSFAEIKNGILMIKKVTRFEDMMYMLTYSFKEWKCVYCGEELTLETRTLDHKFPRDTGGISITNNLHPCCSKCNGKKSNLTHKEYLKVLVTDNKEKRKSYLKNVKQYNRSIMRRIGFKLPRKWVEYEELNNIIYEDPDEILRGVRYQEISEFYKEFKKFPKPAILDKNNRLLNGFNIILFARDFKMLQVPVIKLENLELAVKKEF